MILCWVYAFDEVLSRNCFDAKYEAVRVQVAHFSFDDYKNICT